MTDSFRKIWDEYLCRSLVFVKVGEEQFVTLLKQLTLSQAFIKDSRFFLGTFALRKTSDLLL